MSKVLDIGLRDEHVAAKLGFLLLRIWGLERQVEVLEQRVDELDPPEAEVGADATI